MGRAGQSLLPCLKLPHWNPHIIICSKSSSICVYVLLFAFGCFFWCSGHTLLLLTMSGLAITPELKYTGIFGD